MQKCFLFTAMLFLFFACEKPPAKDNPVAIVPSQRGGIFIVNEGGFNTGNASLSFYDFSSKTLTDDVFFKANGRHLGDVLQSVTVYNGSAYLVVNNSKKVEVIDASTFQSKATITGLVSPRYLTLINSAKAYLSDLYENAISVIDLNSNSVTKKIPCLAGTEQMLIANNKVFVSNTRQNSVYVFDANSDLLIDSVHVSFGSNSLVLDQNNKIWVLCSGDQAGNKFAGIYRINPINDSIEFSIKNIYPAGIFGASKLCINGSKDKLYWLNSDVQSLNINDTVISSPVFVHSLNNTFYGLGVDSANDNIYVSDAVNFTQLSNIFIYNSTANVKGNLKGGINTNGFTFYYK